MKTPSVLLLLLVASAALSCTGQTPASKTYRANDLDDALDDLGLSDDQVKMVEEAAGPNVGDDDDDETFGQFFVASPPAVFDAVRDALAPYGANLVLKTSNTDSDSNNDDDDDGDDDDDDDDADNDDDDPTELSSQDAQNLTNQLVNIFKSSGSRKMI